MFFQLSFPQLFVYGKSKNVCVGWMGDWTEISTFKRGELPQYIHFWRKWFLQKMLTNYLCGGVSKTLALHYGEGVDGSLHDKFFFSDYEKVFINAKWIFLG